MLYYNFGHHGLPLAPVAVLLQPLWPRPAAVPVVILLFPDGRLAGRRWRWVPQAYAVLGAGDRSSVLVAITTKTDERSAIGLRGVTVLGTPVAKLAAGLG